MNTTKLYTSKEQMRYDGALVWDRITVQWLYEAMVWHSGTVMGYALVQLLCNQVPNKGRHSKMTPV